MRNAVHGLYLCRTRDWRLYYAQAEGAKPSRLFISSTKPHQLVTTATLARWMLRYRAAARIDTAAYKAHEKSPWALCLTAKTRINSSIQPPCY